MQGQVAVDVAARHAAAHVAALERALLGHQVPDRQADGLGAGRQARRHGLAAAPRDAVGHLQCLGRPHHLEGMVHAAARQFAHLFDGILVAGVDGVGGAEFARHGQLVGLEVHGHHAGRARRRRAHHRGQAHAAQPHHGHALAGAHPGGIGHRAHAGHHGAAEQRGQLQRHRLVDAVHAAARKHGMLGKGRDADEVRDGLAIARQAFGARQQSARHTGLACGLAEHGPALGAGLAAAAAGHEEHDHMVAHRQIGHALAQRLDHACGLMAEHDGRVARTVAVDDGQVGVAHACGGHLDQHLAGAGRRQVHLPDLQRAAVGIGRGRARSREYGGACLHDVFTSLQLLLDRGRKASSPGMVESTL